MPKVKKVAVVSKNLSVVNFIRQSLADEFQVFFASDCETLVLLLKKFINILVFVDRECDFINDDDFSSSQVKEFITFSTSLNHSAQDSEILSFPDGLSECIKEKCLRKNEIHEESETDFLISKIAGKSRAANSLRKKIQMASMSDLPILLSGESGCGKSLAARIIHNLSSRRENPFHCINVSGLSETLIESELFGNVQGAFTDAKFRKGCFESAENGTLFLDEIGDISLNVQKRLLHVIENFEYRKVGSDEVKKTNVRLIFATNADLEQKVVAKEFRQDLYYRIKRVVIEVPPLRERKEDITDISNMYLAEKYPGKKLSPDSEEFLKSYGWPGNVRQLEACLDRACLFCPNETITPQYLEF